MIGSKWLPTLELTIQSFNLILDVQQVPFDIKTLLGRREWNEMERNEKNHFRIFFHSLI